MIGGLLRQTGMTETVGRILALKRLRVAAEIPMPENSHDVIGQVRSPRLDHAQVRSPVDASALDGVLASARTLLWFRNDGKNSE